MNESSILLQISERYLDNKWIKIRLQDLSPTTKHTQRTSQVKCNNKEKYQPSVEQALHFLDAHGVLVLALHVVDVVRDAGHGRQGDDDVGIAGRVAVAVFNDILQQQVILEYPLYGFEQVRAERQRVLQLRLPLAARPAGCFVPHQLS